MSKAIQMYNNTFHSTIQCTPFEVQNHRVDYHLIRNRLKDAKGKNIKKKKQE